VIFTLIGKMLFNNFGTWMSLPSFHWKMTIRPTFGSDSSGFTNAEKRWKHLYILLNQVLNLTIPQANQASLEQFK